MRAALLVLLVALGAAATAAASGCPPEFHCRSASSCSGDGTFCYSCELGYHGSTCESRCPAGCTEKGCSQTTGECSSGCDDKMAWGTNCTSACPAGCLASYGCDQDSGLCSGSGCSSGGKVWGSRCDLPCQPDGTHFASETCSKTYGPNGTSCENSEWFGEDCSMPCGDGCLKKQCSRTDGLCSYCEPGLWGPLCLDVCQPDGTHFASETCSKTYGPNGTQCVDGFWGEDCRDLCPECRSASCYRTDGTCAYCADGAWGDTCLNVCNEPGTHFASERCDKTRGPDGGACVNGFYGDRCNLTCPDNCQGGGCYRTDGTCSYCVSGFYGPTCLALCSPPGTHFASERCDKTRGSNGSSCQAGWWGDDCRAECPPCSSGSCYRTDGTCSYCESGAWGAVCNETCTPPGSHFYSSTCPASTGPADTQCVAGYFGSMCDMACSEGCSAGGCLQKTAECRACDPGLWGFNCSDLCNPPGSHFYSKTCDQDNGSVNKTCEAGWWGPHCSRPCSDGCTDRGCLQQTGECRFCQDQLWGANCTESCDPPGSHCASRTCDQDDGPCSDCAVGHWGGKLCTEDCSPTCASSQGVGGPCDRDTGVCERCPDTRFGPACDLVCQGGDDNARCASGSCDLETGKCASCLSGYFGDRCNKTCIDNDRCSADDCDRVTGLCRAGVACVAGRYGDANCEHHCFAAPGTQCSEESCARDSGLCAVCADGFWGVDCDRECLIHTCTDSGACDRDSGKCDVASDSCQLGRWGDDCERECPEGCAGRCRRSVGTCLECAPQRWDTSCDQTCSSTCGGDGNCDLATGKCDGCVPGATGPQCEDDCPTAHCAHNNTCSQTTGTCSECELGWGGDLCDKRCLEKHCQGPNNNELRVNCERDTLLCPDGCQAGWWGDHCDKPCGSDGQHCVECTEDSNFCSSDAGCDRQTGACTDCATGYINATGASRGALCTWEDCEPSSRSSTLPARHRSARDATKCVPCAKGRALEPDAGSNTSASAPTGWDYNTATACLECTPGRYQDATGARFCPECGFGSFSPGRGRSACIDCPAGRFGVTLNGFELATSEAVACSDKAPCDGRDYLDTTESPPDCSPCGNGHEPNPQHTECVLCAEGFYYNGTGSDDGPCLACPRGSIRNAEATDCIGCREGYYGNLTTRECEACPAGRYSSSRSPTCNIACPRCLGRSAESDAPLCVSGYHGEGCVYCNDNYYVENGSCHKCSAVPWAMIAGVAMILAALGALYKWGMDLQLTVRLKILTNFFQLVVLTASILVLWPGFVDWIRSALDVMTGGFQGFHSECYSSFSHDQKVYASVWIPLVMVAFGVGLDRAVAWKRRELQQADHGLGADTAADRKLHQASLSIRRLLVLFVTLVYTPMMQLLMSVQDCTDGDPPRLTRDPRVVCEGSDYDGLVRFSVAFGIIIGAGLPLGIGGAVLWISRSDKGLHHGDNLDSVGALYEPYKDHVAWFESVGLLRKALMLLVIAYVDSGVGQALINLTSASIWLAVIYKVHPYVAEYVEVWNGRQVDFNNTLELISSVVTVFNHFLAFLVGVSDNNGASQFFGVLFLLANIAAVLAFNFKFFLEQKKKAKDAEDEDAMYAALNDGAGEDSAGGGEGGVATTRLDPAVAKLATSLGDHMKEMLLELAHRRSVLTKALERRDLRAADGLWSRMKNVEGRVLSEMERQLVVAHQTLDVDQSQLISAWLEQRQQRLYNEELLVGRCNQAEAEARDGFAASQVPHEAALEARRYWPDLARADEQCFAEAERTRAGLDELYQRGADQRSYEACKLAASGAAFVSDGLKKMIGVRGGDGGGPSDRQLAAADSAVKKWRGYVSKFLGRTGARVTEASRLARVPIERPPAADRDEGAEQESEEQRKESLAVEDKLRKVYKKLTKDAVDLWKQFDSQVVPRLVAAGRHRQLQDLYDDLLRQTQERARVHDPQRRQRVASLAGTGGGGSGGVEGGMEGGGGGGEGGDRAAAGILETPGLTKPPMSLDELKSEMSRRHSAAKELLFRDDFVRGQAEIEGIRKWLLQIRAAARHGEWLCLLYSVFEGTLQHQELRVNATSLLVQLGKPGPSTTS